MLSPKGDLQILSWAFLLPSKLEYSTSSKYLQNSPSSTDNTFKMNDRHFGWSLNPRLNFLQHSNKYRFVKCSWYEWNKSRWKSIKCTFQCERNFKNCTWLAPIIYPNFDIYFWFELFLISRPSQHFFERNFKYFLLGHCK